MFIRSTLLLASVALPSAAQEHGEVKSVRTDGAAEFYRAYFLGNDRARSIEAMQHARDAGDDAEAARIGSAVRRAGVPAGAGAGEASAVVKVVAAASVADSVAVAVVVPLRSRGFRP